MGPELLTCVKMPDKKKDKEEPIPVNTVLLRTIAQHLENMVKQQDILSRQLQVQLENITREQQIQTRTLDRLTKGQNDLSEIIKEKGLTTHPEDTEISFRHEDKTLKEINTKVSSFIDIMLEDMERKNLKEAAFKFRKAHKKDWSRILNSRKLAYYHMIENRNIAAIYEHLLRQDEPYIPKKCRESEVPGETEDQKERKMKIGIDRCKAEISRLREQAAKKESLLDKCQTDIDFVIEACPDEATRQKLIELWNDEVKKEENISHQRWATKEVFFNNLKENEAKEEEETRKKVWPQKNNKPKKQSQQQNQRNTYSNVVSGNNQNGSNRQNNPPQGNRNQNNQNGQSNQNGQRPYRNQKNGPNSGYNGNNKQGPSYQNNNNSNFGSNNQRPYNNNSNFGRNNQRPYNNSNQRPYNNQNNSNYRPNDQQNNSFLGPYGRNQFNR